MKHNHCDEPAPLSTLAPSHPRTVAQRCAHAPRLTAIAVLVLAGVACQRPPATDPDLQALLSEGAVPLRGIARDVWADTRKFYAARADAVAWLDGHELSELTGRALDVLHTAEEHGLDPSDYRHSDLRQISVELAAAGEKDPSLPKRVAEFDTRLTAALLQLGRHVATGRLSSDVIDPRWNVQRTAPDYVASLLRARAEGVQTFLADVQPRHPEYEALRKALVGLRGQVGGGWSTVPRARLGLGQWNAAVVVPLRQRLAASGYLPEGASLDLAQYDGDVEQGVKAFQEHHGLAVTGKLDAATITNLNVALERRIGQVALNLERWRWLPDDLGSRHFVVNVPYFHLIAREEGKPVLDIRVVVGKRGNETPLFSDVMEHVVFSPYWNVPETIAVEETAPAVARDPEFLARNNMEVLDRRGRVVPASAIPWGDPEALEPYRFRQRPGANNALGFVKFLFPNRHSVYLHDTPADTLFRRIGRAFSHGCVRVEEPEALARYVLRDRSEWTPDAIHRAMRAGEERHVKLNEPIPIHIIYMTAWVDDQGGLHFQDDVYDYDARQLAAAAARR